MKCKVCGGAGVIQGQAPGLVSCCPACDGNGFIEMTNEEWRKTCSAEDFAYWLADICAWAMEEFRCGKTEKADTEYWREWLKEKHDGNI